MVVAVVERYESFEELFLLGQAYRIPATGIINNNKGIDMDYIRLWSDHLE